MAQMYFFLLKKHCAKQQGKEKENILELNPKWGVYGICFLVF